VTDSTITKTTHNDDGGLAPLVRLAATLDPRDVATTLTCRAGRPPRLAVTSRHTLATTQIQVAGGGWFVSASGKRLGRITRLGKTSERATRVLNPTSPAAAAGGVSR
jgi:hypothetical protein